MDIKTRVKWVLQDMKKSPTNLKTEYWIYELSLLLKKLEKEEKEKC